MCSKESMLTLLALHKVRLRPAGARSVEGLGRGAPLPTPLKLLLDTEQMACMVLLLLSAAALL